MPALIRVSVRTEHDEELRERQNLLQLRLKPLGMMDAAAIIRAIASVDAQSEEVVPFVLDRAECVPLFLEELTRSALVLGCPAALLTIQGQSGADAFTSSLNSSIVTPLAQQWAAKEH